MTTNPAAAVDYARAQLGKPYVFGSAGPASFDCSGLTMRAWQAAGSDLPHQTALQYAAVAHRPIGQAQPGDLVFWNDGGVIHHVALYVGGGQIIEAADYGIPVRQRAISATENGLMPNAGVFPGTAPIAVAGGGLAAPVASSTSSSGSATITTAAFHPSQLYPWNWGQDLSNAQADVVKAVTSFGLKALFLLGGVGLVVLGLTKAAGGAAGALAGGSGPQSSAPPVLPV